MPKLPIGDQKGERGREDTAKLMQEVQKMQAALKQEEETRRDHLDVPFDKI